MASKKIITFLILSSIFGLAHYVAVVASLYWYYWWFDVVMHFLGGIILGLGVHTIASFSRFDFKPTLAVILVVLTLSTFSWEIFEWWADLYQPRAYVIDTVQDIILGYSGGLLAHFTLTKYTIRE